MRASAIGKIKPFNVPTKTNTAAGLPMVAKITVEMTIKAMIQRLRYFWTFGHKLVKNEPEV